jgi:ABC-2 type transport system ATP-binding protein
MISCRDLTKRFGELCAVDHVSLEIPAGSICALLGPNGAGKSTIVKMLTGLLEPTEGEAAVAGLNVRTERHRLKSRIGVLPETLALFDALTCREHLELAGAVYGLSGSETRRRSGDLLAALALEDARDTFADQCSFGMRKKTALALALIHNPQVLFLDEPFEGIDPVTSKTIRDLIVHLARDGVTVFLTSHILAIVEQLAHRILFLRQGQLLWDSAVSGIPHSLEAHYFDLVEAPPVVELPWLGLPRS